MKTPTDPLAILDAIPSEHIPHAIVRLAARAMAVVSTAPRAAGERERCLTPREAAGRLGVHRRWIYNHADELGALRLSRRKLVIPESSVERYVAKRREGRS